jgi:ribosome-binding factor A
VSRRSQRNTGARDYPRTARLNHLLQEIVAEEIERIDDTRLGLFTVVAVEVDSDLNRATVHYTTLGGGEAAEPDRPADGPDAGPAEDAGDPVADALAQHRARLQSAIARQARIKRTPELVFRPDTVISQALRIEEILHDIATDREA